MIAIKILQQKNFMKALLTTPLFDDYLVESATIESFNTFTIDGRIHREFYNDVTVDAEDIPSEDHSRWAVIRPICLDLIKGKRTPLSFKFVLYLPGEKKASLLSSGDIDISPDLVTPALNIRFQVGQVIITTGISYSIFTLDKSAEKAWDEYIPGFLESNGIEIELL